MSMPDETRIKEEIDAISENIDAILKKIDGAIPVDRAAQEQNPEPTSDSKTKSTLGGD